MTTESDRILDPLRKAHEEEYFRKQNAGLAAKIKGRLEMQKAGIKDEALAKDLSDMGFDRDSVRAMFIVPLIEVAWSDDEVQPEELKEILKILKERGIEENSKAYELVSKWLSRGPEDVLYRKAKSLVGPLLGEIKKDGEWILAASKRVADATGGLFGIGIGSKTSLDEEKIIQKLAKRLAG